MAKVGPIVLRTTVDPAFLEAIEKATAAVAELAEQLRRHDLVEVKINTTIEGDNG